MRFDDAGWSVNRTQFVVLGFFVFVWIALIAVLAFSPDVYAQTLRLAPGDRRAVELAFLAASSLLVALLAIGVLRRWRWTFWLILLAFIFGVLRVPAAIGQLIGLLPSSGPIWYETLQGIIGFAQFAIALAMIGGYRKTGVWGTF